MTAADDSVKQDLAALLDATRHDDLGPEMDAVRARLEAWLHAEPAARHVPAEGRRPVSGEEITEYATQMSGGGMHVRWDDPEMERIYPLTEWIPHQRRHGGRVYRRRIIVVEDWMEIEGP